MGTIAAMLDQHQPPPGGTMAARRPTSSRRRAIKGDAGLVMSTLREEIERAVVRPLHASLFGSVARGTEQQGSDVDLLVVQPDFVSEDEKAAFDRLMVTMVFAVDRTVDRDLRTVRLSMARLERLAKSGSMLLVDVLREGRTVWGPPLLEVLAPIVAAVAASSRP